MKLLFLLAFAACGAGSAPRPPPVPTTTYTVRPYGLPSTLRPSPTIWRGILTGTLEVRGSAATLAVTLQDPLAPTRPLARYVITGWARHDSEELLLQLRDKRDYGDATVTYICAPTILGLRCVVCAAHVPGTKRVFRGGLLDGVIKAIELTRADTLHFAISPTEVFDVGRIAGTMTLSGTEVSLSISLDGRVLAPPMHGVATFHGLDQVALRGPKLHGNCTTTSSALLCDLTVDSAAVENRTSTLRGVRLTPERARAAARPPATSSPSAR